MSDSTLDTLLIFRLGSIGDTVVALPCFHAIAEAYANYRRVLLTNSLTLVRASSAESVLQGAGLVDEVIYYPVGDWRFTSFLALRQEFRRLRPVKLIYLADRPTAAPLFRDVALFWAAGIPRIVGGPWTARLRSCRIDPVTGELEYEAERLARTLSGVVRVDLSPRHWDLRLTASEYAKANSAIRGLGTSRTLIGMAPGAKIAQKDWGADNWAALVKSLAQDGRESVLVLVGAADERALCDDLARSWHGDILNLCGLLTPRETAAVLGHCKIFICHDSGPMHLAVTQLTPCVALFGNYNRPRRWHPYGPSHRVIYEPRGIREIGVNRVAQEVRSMISKSSEPARCASAQTGHAQDATRRVMPASQSDASISAPTARPCG